MNGPKDKCSKLAVAEDSRRIFDWDLGERKELTSFVLAFSCTEGSHSDGSVVLGSEACSHRPGIVAYGLYRAKRNYSVNLRVAIIMCRFKASRIKTIVQEQMHGPCSGVKYNMGIALMMSNKCWT